VSAQHLVRYDAMKRKAEQEAWLLAARLSFEPSPRQACTVCGKYKALTHAHHIKPLAYQWADGYVRPDHSHEWLCPTHHMAVHAFLLQSRAKVARAKRHVLDVIGEISETDGNEQYRRVFEIAMRGINCERSENVSDALRAVS